GCPGAGPTSAFPLAQLRRTAPHARGTGRPQGPGSCCAEADAQTTPPTASVPRPARSACLFQGEAVGEVSSGLLQTEGEPMVRKGRIPSLAALVPLMISLIGCGQHGFVTDGDINHCDHLAPSLAANGHADPGPTVNVAAVSTVNNPEGS